MRRRTFLKFLLGIALSASLAGGLGYRYRSRLLRRYIELTLDKSSDGGTLSQHEFQVIRAVFEVISPKPAPSVRDLREFVNIRTSNADGYYLEYKDAVALFESRAQKQFGKSFPALEEESKEKILRDILLPHPSAATRTVLRRKFQTASRILFFRAERRFREFVFPDLLRFYWVSHAGWTAVGYSSHPGIANPPRAYTLAPVAPPKESRT